MDTNHCNALDMLEVVYTHLSQATDLLDCVILNNDDSIIIGPLEILKRDFISLIDSIDKVLDNKQ